MHPPKVANREVRAVIRSLMIGNTFPSGAAVRAALSARHGSRGGVTRIYRLLADERVRLTAPPQPGSAESLRTELQTMQGRAVRAEQRELSHQSRWATEIDQLRQQVAALEPLARQARIASETSDLLHHRLRAAEQRAAALELRLIELQSRDGTGAE